jgi:hypothetical protein
MGIFRQSNEKVCSRISVCGLLILLLFGTSGCETYKVNRVSIKSDSTGTLGGQQGRTFSIECGYDFDVVTQKYQGNIAVGPQVIDLERTNNYKLMIERAIIGELTKSGLLYFKEAPLIYIRDEPEIEIIYVMNFSGRLTGGYSKSWTISIGGYDRVHKSVIFEVTGEFKSIPDMNEKLASSLIAELLGNLAIGPG